MKDVEWVFKLIGEIGRHVVEWKYSHKKSIFKLREANFDSVLVEY